MKTYKISALVFSSLMVASLLSGCVRKPATSSSESESQSESSSQSEEGFILSAVDQKDEFVEFLANRNKPSSQPDGFKANDRAYTVGDDNPFNVKPEITLVGEITGLPVDSSKWTYDFTISARKQGSATDATNTEFEVIDAANCDVQFKAAAIGSTYTISVAPTHVDASKIAQFTKTFTVDVVDGYNVYDEKELGYFDTRALNSNVGEESAVTKSEISFVNKWQEFKTANGLDPELQPEALLLHNNLELTKDDIPSNFFYTSTQASAIGAPADVEGSLLDRAYLYKRTIPGHIEINGNYFGLDFSKIPLIKCADNNPTGDGEVIAHSALIKCDDGSIDVVNLNLTGNAPRAVKNEDNIYGGGLMFIKAAHKASSARLDNMISRSAFITVMTERPDDGYPVLELELNKSKCSNNYNSFLYSWAGHVTAKDSDFSNCGGPIIIQDHWAANQEYEANNGFVVNGYAPSATFIDCVLENYVSGTEAWFITFATNTQVQQIKSMSDLFVANGLGKSYIVDENKVGKTYTELSIAEKASFFNFILLNKSSETEGITTLNVCGQVNILNTKTPDDPATEENETVYETKGCFDYRQPAYNAVCMASAAYQANPSAETQTALVMAALEAGVIEAVPTTEEEQNTAIATITSFVTNYVTDHGVIRGLNKNDAPVFDFGGDLPLGTTDGSAMYEAQSLADSSPVAYSTAAAGKVDKIGDYATLYYGGMMLLFKLYDYVAA